MRILHANFAKGFRGGERQTELLIRALADEGLQQGVLIRHDSALLERLRDVPRLEIHRGRKPYFRKTVPVGRFDLCHAHETKAAQWAVINNFAVKLPYVITRRVPRVPSRNLLTRLVYTRAAATICVSSAIRDSLLKAAPTAVTQLIPDMCAQLPVNETRLLRLRDKYRGKYLVGNIGALVKKHKGQHILIEAMRQLQSDEDVHCLILGEGYDRASLERQAARLTNVELLGFQDDVGTYLRLFDLFAYPSLEEGLGSTLLDAMQAGCPIVASAVGGIPEIVHDQQHGLLVPPGNVEALRSAIVRMRDSSNLSRRLGQAGREWADQFAPAKLTAGHLQLYQQAIHPKPG